MFGITEHQIVERRARSVARAGAASRRLPAWLPGPGVVLTGPGAVAGATGGVAPPVDRTASVDLVWAVLTHHGSWLITANVEAERIACEYDPVAHGFTGLVEVPWHTPDEFASTAAELAGALDALAAGYERSYAINGWKSHYQGGPIGYAQREFEIAPGPAAGGGQPDLRRLTDAPGWPETEADSRRPGRPAVLEVGT